MRFVYAVMLMAVLFVALSATGSAVTDSVEKQILLPIGETADVLKKWWEGEGYRTHRTESKSGRISLYAEKSDARWTVELSPYSALATRIALQYSGENSRIQLQQLWEHLMHYTDEAPAAPPSEISEQVPTAVLAKLESVVCIHARSNEKEIQFSGVIVDSEGLVLCTAHDLQNVRKVLVTLYDGRQTEGKILYRNPLLDLTLIQLPIAAGTAVNLANGRNLLGMGEAVFTAGCPVDLQGTFYSGTINGPPRLVHDQPLWQVHMEVYPGSSGSPVFDAGGNIVGMVKGRYRGIPTVGFLIPFETIIGFLKENHPL